MAGSDAGLPQAAYVRPTTYRPPGRDWRGTGPAVPPTLASPASNHYRNRCRSHPETVQLTRPVIPGVIAGNRQVILNLESARVTYGSFK